MKLRSSLSIVLATVVLGSVAGAAPKETADAPTPAPLEAQPHMKAALASLNVAKNQLLKASPDKGGHRVKAIALVNKAIDQVKKGIAYDDAHSTWLDVSELEAQPHMQAALASLKVAKNQLQKASPDKGGHRVKAIALVNEAIVQVKKGIAFDNAH